MSYAYQRLRIWKTKGTSLANANFIIVNRKTGYLNLTLNGKVYYYDERIDKSVIENDVLLIAFGGGKKEEKKKKKGKIVVKKKK